MSKIRPHLLVIPLILLISIISVIVVMLNRKGLLWMPNKVPARKSSAVRFLERFENDTKKINLSNLRTTQFSNRSDLEVRFWIDAFPFQIHGIVLRRINNLWSAVYIRDLYEGQNFRLIQKNIGAPKSGWEATWQRLEGAGILVLPDAADIDCNVSIIDGASFIVETNTNGTYRAYSYGNPSHADCAEARKIIEILDLLLDEFSLDLRR